MKKLIYGVLLVLFAGSGYCRAQNAPAAVAGEQTVTLGNATVPLTGPWKFHIGDSPQATGANGVVWAQPGFDDSAWGRMDLTPAPRSFDPFIGSDGYVPGWTARAYKDYHGYSWYRLRVNIHAGQAALALKMPDNFDDAYQIYVNGKLIGQYGRFTAQGVTAYLALPLVFPLPAEIQDGPATIAIRMWMANYTTLVDPDAGGLHGPPILGHASAIAGLLQLDWALIDRSQDSPFLLAAILLLALLVAFALYWLDRREPAYLWLGFVCVTMFARSISVIAAN